MGAGGALTLSTMQRVIIYVLTHLGTRKAGKMAHEGKKAMFLGLLRPLPFIVVYS
jgi:hypothetical protein